ncbi:MAG: helix-turn-helix transcriptional regulator [Acidimicrobiia bacterium]|nr:helix-turn-helix transcriptional regulator [Acidimicrobiia bacterium]
MTTPIQEPVPYTDDDFATSTATVREAREKLLTNPEAAAAHRALGVQIDARVERKTATLREVRRALGYTQAQLADSLGIEQGDISKIERRQNLYLSTLARFIDATGGHLRITAVYEDTEVDLDILEPSSNTTDPVDDRDDLAFA